MILLAYFKYVQIPNYAKTNDFAEKQSTDFCLGVGECFFRRHHRDADADAAARCTPAFHDRPGRVGFVRMAKEETWLV